MNWTLFYNNLLKISKLVFFFTLDKDKILLHHITYREDKWDDEKGQRNVNDFLSVTPSIAVNKVVLILNAQTMNNSSQNALLKSLEEPAPNSYIIITTDRPKSLLQTIYSRCQIINIPHVTQHDEIDINELEQIRLDLKDKAKAEGFSLTILAFMVKAVSKILKDFPDFNSSLDPMERI